MSDAPDLKSAYALETPEDNLRLYRAWAETYDADFVVGTGFRLPRLVTEVYAQMGGNWPCLDVGCGTGAVARALPDDAIVDGLDLSPDMLKVSARLGRYRQLIEANLKDQLPLADGSYQGLLSSGTFTLGHVGAEALCELIRILAPGALAVISVRDAVWDSQNFDLAFDQLVSMQKITPPERRPERIYQSEDTAPNGHGSDIAFITTFRRR